MSQKEPKGTIWNTDLGKQDERTDGRMNGRTNEQTDSLLELARFYPAAKYFDMLFTKKSANGPQSRLSN